MSAERPTVEGLLHEQHGDAGCAAGVPILDAYVELELAGEDPALVYPGTAAHLRGCVACRTDHDGLLDAARSFGSGGPFT